MLRARQGRFVLQSINRLGISWRQGRYCKISRGVASNASKLPSFDPGPTFRQTEPPNPAWKYGEGYEESIGAEEWAKEAEAGYQSIDTSGASPKYVATGVVCIS